MAVNSLYTQLFESGSESPTGLDQHGCCFAYSIQDSTTYFRDGSHSMRFEVDADDDNTTGSCTGWENAPNFRCQQSVTNTAVKTALKQYGVGIWIGLSLRLPSDWPKNIKSPLMMQVINTASNNGGPEFHININADGTTMYGRVYYDDTSGNPVGTRKIFDNVAYNPAQWNDIVIYYVRALQGDGNSGVCYVWVNGVQVSFDTGPNARDWESRGATDQEFDFGIYYSSSTGTTDTFVCWYDSLRIAQGTDPAGYDVVNPGQTGTVIPQISFPTGTTVYTQSDSSYYETLGGSAAAWNDSGLNSTAYPQPDARDRWRPGEDEGGTGNYPIPISGWLDPSAGPLAAGTLYLYWYAPKQLDRNAAIPITVQFDDNGDENYSTIDTVYLNLYGNTFQNAVQFLGSWQHSAGQLKVYMSGAGLDGYVANNAMAYYNDTGASAGSNIALVADTIGSVTSTSAASTDTDLTTSVPAGGSASTHLYLACAAFMNDNAGNGPLTLKSGSVFTKFCEQRCTGTGTDRASLVAYYQYNGAAPSDITFVMNEVNTTFKDGLAAAALFSNTKESDIIDIGISSHSIDSDTTNHFDEGNSTDVVHPAVSGAQVGSIVVRYSFCYPINSDGSSCTGISSTGNGAITGWTNVHDSYTDLAGGTAPMIYASFAPVDANGDLAAETVTFAGLSSTPYTEGFYVVIKRTVSLTADLTTPNVQETSVTKNTATAQVHEYIRDGNVSGGDGNYSIFSYTPLNNSCTLTKKNDRTYDYIEFLPTNGFDGTAQYELTIQDSSIPAQTSKATVSVSVDNTSPVATAQAITVLANATDVDFDMSGWATDANGDSLTYEVVVGTDTTDGNTTAAMNGSTTLRVQAGATTGAKSGITFQANDGSNNNPRSSETAVTITVVASAGTVTASDFDETCTRDQTNVLIDFLSDGSFTDSNGQPLSLSTVNGSACTYAGAQTIATTYGYVSVTQVNGEDRIYYNPDPSLYPYGDSLTDSISLVATNGTNSNTAVTMTITITSTPISGNTGWVDGWDPQ